MRSKKEHTLSGLVILGIIGTLWWLRYRVIMAGQLPFDSQLVALLGQPLTNRIAFSTSSLLSHVADGWWNMLAFGLATVAQFGLPMMFFAYAGLGFLLVLPLVGILYKQSGILASGLMLAVYGWVPFFIQQSLTISPLVVTSWLVLAIIACIYRVAGKDGSKAFLILGILFGLIYQLAFPLSVPLALAVFVVTAGSVLKSAPAKSRAKALGLCFFGGAIGFLPAIIDPGVISKYIDISHIVALSLGFTTNPETILQVLTIRIQYLNIFQTQIFVHIYSGILLLSLVLGGTGLFMVTKEKKDPLRSLTISLLWILGLTFFGSLYVPENQLSAHQASFLLPCILTLICIGIGRLSQKQPKVITGLLVCLSIYVGGLMFYSGLTYAIGPSITDTRRPATFQYYDQLINTITKNNQSTSICINVDHKTHDFAQIETIFRYNKQRGSIRKLSNGLVNNSCWLISDTRDGLQKLQETTFPKQSVKVSDLKDYPPLIIQHWRAL